MGTKNNLLLILFLFVITPIYSQLYINEVVASNKTILADTNGEYDDWIEIYNDSNSPIDIAGYYLSDDPLDLTQYIIPISNAALTTVPANGYLIFWADNDTEQGVHHTNFKLSASGGDILLTAPDEVTIIDNFSFPSLAEDISYGRLPDGSMTLSSISSASPNATNNNNLPQLEKPIINLPTGFYSGPQTISITASTGATIYYTTDGRIPTDTSNLYVDPIIVDSTGSIRAVAIRSNFENSFITTNTYLIDFNSTLPVFHITMNPDDLYDDSIGIYVAGTNGITGYCSGDVPKNYNQDWERPAHLKIFKDGNLVAENNIGVKIGGNCKRRKSQKPLNIYFRDEYSDTGENELTYPIFPDNKINYFKRLYVRSGNNTQPELLNDLVIARMLTGKVDLDTQSGQPAIIFLNGKYVGIQNIREKYDKWHYEHDFKNVDKDKVDVIKNPGRYDVTRWWPVHRATQGDTIEWRSLINEIRQSDYTIQNNYEQIQEKIDTDELINYLTAGHFFSNRDWIANNQKVWKEQGEEKKWRWCMVDFDNTLKPSSVTYNSLDLRILQTFAEDHIYYESNLLYLKLFENDKFKYEYIQRMNTYLGLLYNNTNFDAEIEEYYNEILPDLAPANELFGHTLTQYDTLIQSHKDFVMQRGEYVRQHIRDQFSITDTFDLNINFDQNSNGKVLVNSNFFEIPYNYTGEYFVDIPMEIHAVPNAGYRFSHWLETGETNPHLYQSFSSNTTLTPVFEPALALIINEVHYHPNDTINRKEFVEIYNPDNQSRALEQYQFSTGLCFTFPEGATIAPNEYIIIAEDSTQYSGNGYQVFQWEESGLDKDGESLVLQNPLQQTIDSIIYNDKKPWDEVPDGQGYSLELLHPSFDQMDPLNWFRSDEINGTPGAENSRICNAATTPIVINEINYNSDNDNFDSGDWIELYNPTSNAVNLRGWTFYNQDGKYVFPIRVDIPAEGYVLLVEDAAAFKAAFTDTPAGTFIGELPFSLSNKGERLSLFDRNKCLVDYVIYDDEAPWVTAPDGEGSTLALVNSSLDNVLANSWKASADLSVDFTHGSPGKSNLCAGIINTIVSRQISNSVDDAEEQLSDGSVTISSTDLDLVNDEDVVYVVGLRFRNIGIPQGATITSAVIEFVTDEKNTVATNLIIKGENIDHARIFQINNNNITNRTTTASSVSWQPQPWDIVGENGVNQRTVDLSSIIQEIVNRPGFTSGNAMAFIMEGTGIRTAESFDGSPLLAPKLCITYSSGECGIQAKVLLEGYYDDGTQEMHTQLQDKGLLPMLQPFNTAPWNYAGTESTTTFPSTAVDWVLLMLRNEEGTITNQSAGFIDQAGNLLSVEGMEGIPIADAENQYFSIHTRSHLAILSANTYTGGMYDFTTAGTKAQGLEQQKLASGKYILYSGDYDGNGIINNADFNKWKIQSAKLNEYLSIDGDGNGIINAADYNLWINNRSKIGEPIIRY